MKWLWITLAGGVFSFGATSCSTILGCHNPTGYCGDNVPDRDRVGGPSWFLSTDPASRMAYYAQKCQDGTAELRGDTSINRCAVTSIRQEAFQTCVYYETPRWADNAPSEEDRRRDRIACQQKILTQHGLTYQDIRTL